MCPTSHSLTAWQPPTLLVKTETWVSQRWIGEPSMFAQKVAWTWTLRVVKTFLYLRWRHRTPNATILDSRAIARSISTSYWTSLGRTTVQRQFWSMNALVSSRSHHTWRVRRAWYQICRHLSFLCLITTETKWTTRMNLCKSPSSWHNRISRMRR